MSIMKNNESWIVNNLYGITSDSVMNFINDAFHLPSYYKWKERNKTMNKIKKIEPNYENAAYEIWIANLKKFMLGTKEDTGLRGNISGSGYIDAEKDSLYSTTLDFSMFKFSTIFGSEIDLEKTIKKRMIEKHHHNFKYLFFNVRKDFIDLFGPAVQEL